MFVLKDTPHATMGNTVSENPVAREGSLILSSPGSFYREKVDPELLVPLVVKLIFFLVNSSAGLLSSTRKQWQREVLESSPQHSHHGKSSPDELHLEKGEKVFSMNTKENIAHSLTLSIISAPSPCL